MQLRYQGGNRTHEQARITFPRWRSRYASLARSERLRAISAGKSATLTHGDGIPARVRRTRSSVVYTVRNYLTKKKLAPTSVFVVLMFAGCAGVASFPPQPALVWGFYGFIATTSVEGYTWAPYSRQVCDAVRANAIALNKKNAREGRAESTVGDCEQLSVVAGGMWWGFTFHNIDGGSVGRSYATNSKELCDIARRSVPFSHIATQCSPVTVKVQ